MSEETWQKIIIVLVDKGLLVLIFTIIGIFISRSIEKFKSNLSWSGELLNQRLGIARKLVSNFKELEEAHLQLSIMMAYSRNIQSMDKFSQPRDKALENLRVAQLLFPKGVFESIDAVIGSYENIFNSDSLPVVSENEIQNRTQMDLDLNRLSSGEVVWHEKTSQELKKSIQNAVKAIRSSIPSEVNL